MSSNQRHLILSIETSADFCSAALSDGDSILTSCSIEQPRAQSSSLAPAIGKMLEEAHVTVKDCAAIAVSSGPGSYTGLRVGVSLAKGLCFGAGIPLIGVGTLDLIVHQALEMADGNTPDFIVPMIDARRMEVYQAVYNSGAELVSEIEPKILDESSYADILEKGTVLFCGDGCEKFANLCHSDNARFFPCRPDARYMAKIARRKYQASDFEDVAYMEPFYLKDFRIGQSKKNILGL